MRQPVPELYFAYASNMASQHFARICPSAVPVGPAFLPDHRLAFTHYSPKWDGGVADVSAATGMRVWGVAYHITNQCRVALDLREGNGVAYIRHPVAVTFPDGDSASAIAYKVIKPVFPEIRPAERYIYTVSEGAAEYGLPGDYQDFLVALWSELGQPAFRTGLMVTRYVDGTEVHINPADIPKGDGERLKLHYHKHQAPVTLVPNAHIPPRTCYVGAVVRDALLLPKGLYGAMVRIEAP